MARVLARQGPSNFGIVPVQRVPEDQVGDILESKWIRVQGMVLNRQLPFHGMDRHYRSHLLSKDEPPSISAKHMVLDVLNGKAHALDAKAMLTISTRCVSHCDPPLFEKLFSLTKKKVKLEWCLILRRRIVLRIPSYSPAIIKQVRDIVHSTIHSLPLTRHHHYTLVCQVV